MTKDVSQERLAFDAGVDRSYLGGLERAEENPTIDILDKLVATLGIDLGELFAQPSNTETYLGIIKPLSISLIFEVKL